MVRKVFVRGLIKKQARETPGIVCIGKEKLNATN